MRLRSPCRLFPLGVLGIVIFIFSVQSAFAARLLDVYIERDGNVIVHTYYDDGGRADAATVWRYLGDPPIMVEDEATHIAADASRPLELALEGDILLAWRSHRPGAVSVNVAEMRRVENGPLSRDAPAVPSNGAREVSGTQAIKASGKALAGGPPRQQLLAPCESGRRPVCHSDAGQYTLKREVPNASGVYQPGQ
jgi:hypothetical protein